MNYYNTSLILIGMPASGKSTIGELLAKSLKKDFIDTDTLIEQRHNSSLQAIVDAQGQQALRSIEENVLLNSTYPNHVIATGGSAVYSPKAMAHLKHFGLIVFLDVELSELEKRLHNIHSRGLAKRADQSLADLFAERRPLYQEYADITIDCAGKTHEQIINTIIYEEGETYSEVDA
ncbi:MAG TPA: shikimate kinase [Cellvibrio sp.]|nr:shikimate kinase [Cellvibrio sp.]